MAETPAADSGMQPSIVIRPRSRAARSSARDGVIPPAFMGLTLMPWNASVQASRSAGEVMLSSAITGIGLRSFRIRACSHADAERAVR